MFKQTVHFVINLLKVILPPGLSDPPCFSYLSPALFVVTTESSESYLIKSQKTSFNKVLSNVCLLKLNGKLPLFAFIKTVKSCNM